jgi:hypothetical protein
MTNDSPTEPPFTEREQRIFRSHAKWASVFIVYSLIVCFLILGGAFVFFEYAGLEDRVRVPILVLLATMILVNVIWRAAAEKAARIHLLLQKRDDSNPNRRP